MIDVVIVNYNTLKHLRNCVESVIRCGGYNKLIVVDNGSTDKSAEWLRDKVGITLIQNKRNLGYGYANNQGIAFSDSEYVCLLNSDTIVTDNWLKRMQETLESNDVSMVSCMTDYVFVEEQKAIPSCDINSFSEKLWQENKTKCVQPEKVIGFCLLIKREHLKEVGDVFDERFEIGNFEDDDLSARMKEAGYKIGCCKGVFVQHIGSQTLKAMPDAQAIFERNKVLFFEKWDNRKHHESLDIVYVLPSDLPCGGIKIAFEHCNRLIERGHKVSIIAERKLAKKNWFNLKANITYQKLENLPYCDIMVSTFYTTIAAVEASSARIKVHLSQGYEGLYTDKEAVKTAYKLTPNKIAVSSWLVDCIKKNTGMDSIYVQNGIDQYVFSFKTKPMNEKPRVLVVGDNLEIKGITPILEALKPIQNKITLVRMFSEKDPSCESYKMPDMTQQEIADVYASCDILVSGSQKVEGFGLPPLEAMASGCAVVTTNNGGNSEYIKNNINCLVYDYGNKEQLRLCVESVLNSKETYDKLTTAGLETAEQYKWYKAIDTLENYYLSLASTNTTANIKPELIAIYKTFRGDEFLIPSIESIYDRCKKIVFIHCDTSWNGRKGNTCKPVLAKWKKENDKENKIIEHTTEECDQEKAYLKGWELANKHSHDWKFLIDTDEVWDKENLNRLLNSANRHNVECIRTKTYFYVKSPEYQMAPMCPMTPTVLCKANAPYRHIRMMGGSSYVVLTNVFYHHFSLVRRSMMECIEKQQDCNKAEDVIYDVWQKWIHFKWNMMPNPHFGNEKFKRITIDQLPEVLRNHELTKSFFAYNFTYKYPNVEKSIGTAAKIKELLKQYNLPEDFNESHSGWATPSKRNRYLKMLEELGR